MNANLALLLDDRAQRHPDLPAVIAWRAGRFRTWSFADMAAGSRRVAGTLAGALSPGSTLLVWQSMSPDLYMVLLGAWRAGMTVMFIDPAQPLATREACARLVPPSALAGPPLAHAYSWLTPSLRRIRHRFTARGWWPGTIDLHGPRAGRELVAPHPCRDDTPALITFTSGSTGQPKGIVRTHGFLARQNEVIGEELRLGEGQVDLTALPVFLLANLAAGVTSVIPRGRAIKPGAINPDRILRQMKQLGVTRGGASPSFWARLVAVDHDGRLALSALREIYTGGGPVYPTLLRDLSRAAPRASVVGVYGSTEAEPIAVLPAEEVQTDHPYMDTLLPVGKPVARVDVMVIADHWGTPLRFQDPSGLSAMRLPDGCIGEIIVRGPLVVSGYWEGRGDGETKITVGESIWHRTGDAGCLDEHGRLWLAGRCSAKVMYQGRVVYPLTVEIPVRRLRQVRQSALTTVDDQACLVIETDDHARATVAVAGVLSGLGLGKLPVVCLGKIPVDRRHNAKIDYQRLRGLLVGRKVGLP